MRTLRSSIAALAAVALTAGLATAVLAHEDESHDHDHSEDAALEGTTWILHKLALDGPGMLEHLPRLVTATMILQDGEAGGSGGCNSWFSDYELEGESLTFGAIGTTMMACPGPVAAVEQTFLAYLDEVASWSIDGPELTLSDAEGNELMLLDKALEATLVGSWVAQSINNGMGGVESNEHTSKVTAIFDPDGQLAGSDGCNNYMTSYETDLQSISISPTIATTRAACSPELDELSSQYFAALTAAATWSVDASGSLELRDDGGALQVKYLPAE